MNKPESSFETELGTVNATMTEAEHVHLSGDLAVNNVDYRVSLHLFLIDGVWQPRNFRELYMSRRDHQNKEATDAAKRKVREVLPPAWTRHLASNPGMGDDAQRAHLEQRIGIAEGEERDLTAKLGDKRDELAKLRAELDKLVS